MNLNDLLIFVTVAKQGSLTKAAKQLDMPKSTLSRRLSELEQHFACQLLIRSKKRILLSNDGQELFDRSANLIEQLNWVKDDLSNQVGQLKGKLSIQIPIDFYSVRFTEIIQAFLNQHPQLSIQISHYMGEYPSTVDAFDLTFVQHNLSLPDSDFIARSLMSFSQSIYCASFKSQHFTNLDFSEVLTLYDEKQWFFGHDNKQEAIKVSGRLQFPNQTMLLDACLLGLGAAKLLDNQVEPFIRNGQLTKLNTHLPLESLTLSLLYKGGLLSKKAELFIAHFQSEIGVLNSRL